MNLIESLQAELKADRLKIQSYESSSARESLEANQASLLIVELNDLKEIIMQRDQRIQ